MTELEDRARISVSIVGAKQHAVLERRKVTSVKRYTRARPRPSISGPDAKAAIVKVRVNAVKTQGKRRTRPRSPAIVLCTAVTPKPSKADNEIAVRVEMVIERYCGDITDFARRSALASVVTASLVGGRQLTFEDHGHSIVVVRNGDLVGGLLGHQVRIVHGHAVAGPGEHVDVVGHVAERDHV